MKVTMLLADAAQVAEGKLFILGGGWSVTGPQASAMAIAMHVEVPWDRANMRHSWTLELLNADGQPVSARDPLGRDEPIRVQGEFEVGRPVGLTPGTPIGVATAINLAPVQLPPGGRYEWRLTIGDEAQDDWRLSFGTRPAVSEPGAPGQP